MADATVKIERDLAETASIASSQTLVDEASDLSYEKIEMSPGINRSQTIDAVMEVKPEEDPVKDTARDAALVETVTEAKATVDGLATTTDVKMSDAVEVQTVDQKVLNALEYQKRSSGTDQQDVEEVMGSILNRLQAAIRPTTIDESTGIQIEKIMETFYVTTINYTKKFDDRKYQQEVSFDRSITAFPAPEGACSLYDALGRNFDQQIIEESKLSRYTVIKTLPPVLHVLIQRTQSTGSKNGNPVVIPETLYLDRYMDTPHDSETFQERVRSWMIANRISDLEALNARLEANPPTGALLEKLSAGLGAVAADTGSLANGNSDNEWLNAEENWDFDGSVDDDFLLVSAPKEETQDTAMSEPTANPEWAENLETAIREGIQAELRQRKEDLEKHYSSLRKIPYRLHAVICHRGQLMSGHYWVWIHDFEENVWRKYNDSNVEANCSTEEVLNLLSTSGEPYFLCYVRDEDKDSYVDVPRRQRHSSPGVEEGDVDADGDLAFYNNETVAPDTTTSSDPAPYIDTKTD